MYLIMSAKYFFRDLDIYWLYQICSCLLSEVFNTDEEIL